MVNKKVWQELRAELDAKGVTLVAVSKKKPISDIQELYDLGQRDFGENYVQELVDKQLQLPADIHWHYIGHLQSNKIKYIIPFVHLIHAVDSFNLLSEINKRSEQYARVTDVLLQMHIADEETKFGLDEHEIIQLVEEYAAQNKDLQHVRICGLMGMATNSDDAEKVGREFWRLHNFFVHLKEKSFTGKPCFSICSMGMSADYELAIKSGSTMVRIGSKLFGAR